MPPDPLRPFLFLGQLQIISAEKNTLEKYVEIMAPLLKFLATLMSKSRGLAKLSERRLPPL